MSNTVATSKMISLVPTNGTEFDLQAGQKIIFEVPPSLGLIKGRDSYLALDIVNTSSDKRRLALNSTAGCDAVLSRVDIYSLQNGTHLETLQNYNQWSSMDHQYLYDDKTNLQTLVGCGHDVYANDGVVPAPVVSRADQTADTVLSPIKTDGTQFYNFRRYTTPLKAGILRWWDDERLCPVIAMGGLRIEITLEDPKVALNILDAVEADGTAVDISSSSANGISMADNASGGDLLTLPSTNAFTSVEECGLAIGNTIRIGLSGSPDITDAVVSGLTINATKLDITFTSVGTPAGVPNGATNIIVRLRNDTRSATVRPQFRVLSIAPDAGTIQSMAGGVNYEFTSYDCHFSTLLASATRHQVELNSVATKAVCLMSNFVNTSLTDGERFSSYFNSAPPSQTDLNSVQYFLNNRLAPVRAYNPTLKSEKIVAQHELVKAFDSISYEAKDLGNADGANLEGYTNSFMIARQLAKRPYYYNLKEAEGQIRLSLQNTATRTQPFQITTFVWSKRVVSIGSDGSFEVML